MRGKSLMSMIVAMMSWPAVVCGQSMNIDFGDEAGTPSPTYGAAGLPGVWNVIHQPWDFPPPPFGTFSLVDLQGRPTSATLTAVDTLGTFLNDPGAPTGDDAALFQDGLISQGPEIVQTVIVNGLENGLYRLITYSWVWPSEQFAMAVFVDGSNVVYSVGGPWPGAPTLGVTHMMHILNVTDGTIKFNAIGDGPGSFFNGNNFIQGMQLWKIDDPPTLPCPADIAPAKGNGVVDVDDLLDLINSWAQTGVPADITGNGIVDVDDLLALINAWGDCPTLTPISCGDPKLDDCYVAHGSPGCGEPACCDAVCTFDPYCCQVEWDGLCAGIANIAAACEGGHHPNCGNELAGDCKTNSFPIVQGCSDSECCAIMCAIDPYCCQYGWDGFCVANANLFCSDIPAGCGHPESGDCFSDHFTPFCTDAKCCETVCSMDSYCCDTLWDEICAAIAQGYCKGGSCGDGAGNCFAVHATPGCEDPACCAAVCSQNPFCCEVEWDFNCTAFAEFSCVPTAK